MSLIVTASVTIDGTRSLMVLAASSDSKTTMLTPESSFRVQYPAMNPGACDTPGTTCSRKWLVAASRSLTVTVTTTACIGTSLVAGWRERGLYPGVGEAPLRTFSCDIAYSERPAASKP